MDREDSAAYDVERTGRKSQASSSRTFEARVPLPETWSIPMMMPVQHASGEYDHKQVSNADAFSLTAPLQDNKGGSRHPLVAPCIHVSYMLGYKLPLSALSSLP